PCWMRDLLLKTRNDLADEHRRDRLRVGGRESVEIFARQPREVRIAHRIHRRAAAIAAEDRHLADRLAAPEPGEPGPRPVLLPPDDAQASVDDEIQRVADVALMEQRLAAAERHELERRLDVLKDRPVQRAEQPASVQRDAELRSLETPGQ